MHELSIALSLIDAVSEQMPHLGSAVSVRKIHVRIGPQSGVAAEALAFAFDVAVAESPLAGAVLCIEKTEGRELELAAVEVIDGPSHRRGAAEHPEEE